VLKQGWDPEVSRFFEPEIRSMCGTSCAEISAFAALYMLSDELEPSDEYCSCISQPGGNAHIARGVAALVGEQRIQTGAFVANVKNANDEVHVEFFLAGQPRTIRAKTVIYAMPRFMAPHIVPELLNQGTSEPSAFRYAPYAVANVHVRETPPGLAFCNETHDDGFLITDFIVGDWAGQAVPTQAPLSRPNILTAYAPLLGPTDRSALLHKPMEYFAEPILDDMERLIPGLSEILTQVDLYRWGHPMLVPYPGFVFSKHRQSARAPVGKIYFAGHETEGISIIDHAFIAGVRAALEVSEILS